MGLRSLGQTAWTLILEPVTLGRLPELSVPPLSHLEMDIKKKKNKKHLTQKTVGRAPQSSSGT